jgi:hypothetical protein
MTPTKAECPVTKGSGDLQCQKQPFGELPQSFPVPAGTPKPEVYCTDLCGAAGAQGSYDVPVFPGCRAYTYDGTSCKLFGCYPGGQGAYAATIVAAAGTTYGTLSATCYPSGHLPTPAPTQTCVYSNDANPPKKVPDSKPIANSCKIYTSTISNDFVGTTRDQLDWCQEGCTNIFAADGCTAVELYGATAGGNAAKCVYATCTNVASTATTRTLYRSVKSTTC